jgi:hypothetical protein
MHKTSNEQALGFIDSFLGKIAFEKKAADRGGTEDVEAKDVGGYPAGTEKANVCCRTDGVSAEERTNPQEGEFGREKDSDYAEAIPNGQSATSKGSANKAPSRPQGVTGDFNTQDASMNKESEERFMANEMQRARRLGDKILEKVAALGRVPQAEKLVKTAADQAYVDFVESYKLGLAKRAEDEKAVKDSLGVDDDTASKMLDDVAAEDPDSVMPADGDASEPDGDEGAAPMPGGEIPEMDASGAPDGGAPSPDDAAQLLQDLIGMGIPPEVIEAAVNELDGEAPEVAKQAMERSLVMRKQAAAQQQAFAKLHKTAQESYLKKTAAEQKVWFDKLGAADKQAFLMKTAAEQFENLKNVVRDFRHGLLK